MQNWLAKVLSLVIALFIFIFHRVNLLETKVLTVPLTERGSSEFVIANSIPDTVRITLRGEKDAISPITENDIEAYIDLSGYVAKGSYRPIVQIIRLGDALDVDPLEIDPKPLDIFVQLDSNSSKMISISPDISGSVANGYELVSKTVMPSQVLIEGPSSIVDKMSSILTERIDLGGRNSDFTKIVKLVKTNDAITINGSNNAEFQARIKSISIVNDFEESPIGIKNLKEGFTATLSHKTAHIRLQGPMNDIEHIASEADAGTEHIAFVDCRELQSAGTYTLPLKINIPDSVETLSLDPESIQVEIQIGQ